MTKSFVPSLEAVELLIEGQKALSQVESVGIRVDKGYLEGALDSTAAQIKDHEVQIRSDPAFKHWRRRFGEKTSFETNGQLAAVVFEDLGFRRKLKRNKTKKDSDEEGEFEGIDHPLVRNYFASRKLRKARATYLLDIQRNMVCHGPNEWRVHPHFHLNTVATFRSSASNPNWQNNPNRNPYIAEIVRKSYIASQGFALGEVDQAQIETRTPCFYSFDPNLMDYCEDPTKDMHRDMAVQLFKLTQAQGKDKPIRHIAKNRMVFPTFYGGYFKQTAASMWEALVLEKIKVAGTDTPMIEHLAAHGIHSLGECDPNERAVPGTFEHHVAEIEADFWGRRFKVLAQWKRDWLAAYQRDGGCRFLTGFIMIGPHVKNDITNYCIQGVSFHLCLWSLIKINRILRKYKFRTRVIGEIHDCINFEGPPSERDDVINLFVKVMESDVRKHWPWINVRIPVEPEACPVDGSWFNKAALVKAGDTWVPAKMDDWEKKYGAWQ